MKVLLVGGGIRGHAVAQNLSAHGHEIFSVLPNPHVGIGRMASKTLLCNLKNARAIAAFARRVKAEVAFIGPEEPLFARVANSLEKAGVPTYAPSQRQARL